MEFPHLVSSVEWSEFQECYRTKRVCLHESDSSDRFRLLWSEWELDALCRFTPLANVERFRLVRDAKRVPPAAFRDRFGMVRAEAVRQLYAGGVSVTLGNLEFFSDPVLSLGRSLERALHCPVQVSFYATPRASQALGAHRDEHDVLVLQLYGVKTWEIFHAPDDPSRDAEQPLHYTLRKGSWLFVPKNMRHEVKNQGTEPSVHLTIGFHPLTWSTIFQGALERAHMESPALNQTIVHNAAHAESREAIAARLLELINFVDVPAQADTFFRNHPAFAQPVPDFISRDALESVGEHSRFVWRKDNASLLAKGVSLEVHAAYRKSPLELRPEFEPALKRMANGADFRPADLGLPEREANVLLCKFLAQVGALRLLG